MANLHFSVKGSFSIFLLAVTLLFFTSCKITEKTLLAEAAKKGLIGREIPVEEAKNLKNNFDVLKQERVKEGVFSNYVEFVLDDQRLVKFLSDTSRGGSYIRICNALTKDNKATVVFQKIDVNTNRIDAFSPITDEAYIESIKRFYSGAFLSKGQFKGSPFIISEIFSTKFIFDYLTANGRIGEIKALRVYYGLSNNIMRFVLTRADFNGKDGLAYIGGAYDGGLKKQKGGDNDNLLFEDEAAEHGCCQQYIPPTN